MKKEAGLALEVAGYALTTLLAVCTALATADLMGEVVADQKFHFYDDIYQHIVGEAPPEKMLTDRATKGRVGLLGVLAGFGFAIARIGKSIKESAK